MATNRYSFTPVISDKGPGAGGDEVLRCGALLYNKMQCTKFGVFWVEDANTPEKDHYQVCLAHKQIMEAEGTVWQMPAPKPMTEPKPVQPPVVPAPAGGSIAASTVKPIPAGAVNKGIPAQPTVFKPAADPVSNPTVKTEDKK